MKYSHVYAFKYCLWIFYAIVLILESSRVELLQQKLYGPQTLAKLSDLSQKKLANLDLHQKEYINKGYLCLTDPNKNMGTVFHIL